MRVVVQGLIASMALVVGAAAAGPTGRAMAAGVPVSVDVESLRCVQNYALSPRDDDHAYLMVTGVAAGKDVAARFPETGTLTAAPKKPPILPKEMLTLWKGELDPGQFAVLTVDLFEKPDKKADNDEAPVKQFITAIAASDKKLADTKKSLTDVDAKGLGVDLLKANRAAVTDVKTLLSREKGTDHFNGQFTLLIWNDGGKIKKRVDPVGLTAGEHFGTDSKVYTKIKFTRNNVLIQDEGGEWYPQTIEPLSQDKSIVRIKMLETEFVKDKKKDDEGKEEERLVRNTTDYVAGIQVKADSKPLAWTLGPQQPDNPPSQVHAYFDYAE